MNLDNILTISENLALINSMGRSYIYSLDEQIARAQETSTFNININSDSHFLCESIYSEFEFDANDLPQLKISIADLGKANGEQMSSLVPFSLISSNGKKGNNFFNGFDWQSLYLSGSSIEIKVYNPENVNRKFSISFKGYSLQK